MGLFAFFFRSLTRRARPAPPPVRRPAPPQTPMPMPAPKPPPAPERQFRRYPDREERARRAISVAERACNHGPQQLKGKCWVVDGDTIVIDHIHIRLAGIDAPELDQPWGKKAKWELVRLCKGHVVTAHVSGELSHNRVVARCLLPDGRDLSRLMVERGLALDWAAYSGGCYRQYEPAEARKRLWRAAARQSAPRAP